MAIVRFAPFPELAAVQSRMNKLYDDTVRFPHRSEEGPTLAAWSPAVDIYETDKELVLKAELPELSRKDIDIKIENNILTISGERRMEREVKKEQYHRVERSYGDFLRRFTLPHSVDRENIKANYQDGVLKISLPKKDELKPKQIKIDVGQG